MPASVTHIVLALAILPLLPDKDEKEFLLGTSFPDIRYLGVIEREKTHNLHATWRSIQKEQSSFKAGIEFHSLVDRIHDDYIIKHNVYKCLPFSNPLLSSYLLKFYEDIIFYEYGANWHKIATYFNTVLDEELMFGIKEKLILTWHNRLYDYLTEKPTVTTALELLVGNTMLIPYLTENYVNLAISAACSKKLQEICTNFYEQFVSLIEAESQF